MCVINTWRRCRLCAEGQGEHYVALSEELEDHIDFFTVHSNFDCPQIIGTYRMGYGKLSLKWFSSLVSSNLHFICNHIYTVFNALYDTCDRFATLVEVYFQSFPQIYIDISDVLPKEKKSRINVSVLRLVRQLGSFSGPVLELKHILSSKRCNSGRIELMPEPFSWY